ncbi:MAG: acetyl-CoA carboxylase biotin carboxyl carrier protein [bacterium]
MDKNELLKFIRELIFVFEKSSASEIEVEEEGVRLALRKKTSLIPPSSPPIAVMEEKKEEEPFFGDNVYYIRAPMTGVFYRSPSPNSPPFVEEGDIVVKGQRLALLEAMKIFNDITAEVSGKILAIMAQNASLVQEGEVLFVIEPREEIG